MSDIEELQRRITAAIDRIAAGIDAVEAQPAGADPAELDALRAERDAALADRDAAAADREAAQKALEEERLVTAQLEERIRKLKERHAIELAEAQTQMPSADHLQRLDIDLQRLRKANDQLRQSNAALREANEEGVGEPHLINKAMLAELEGLRAARAADVAEATSIMAQLVPLLEKARDLPEGEDA